MSFYSIGLVLRRFPLNIANSTTLKYQWRFLTATSTMLGTSGASSSYSSSTGDSQSAVKQDLKTLSDTEWAKRLTPEQFHVCRASGTEPPFSGKYYTHSESGTYTCSCCGADLFSSEVKYDSGSGWPSFFKAINASIIEHTDQSMGMSRTEVQCAQCNAHLGHVFNDGPQPTGMRYCINSVCLEFTPKAQS